MNGLTSSAVAKLKISPKVMDIGKAGNAFLQIANRRSVKQRPCKRKENNMLGQTLDWGDFPAEILHQQTKGGGGTLSQKGKVSHEKSSKALL